MICECGRRFVICALEKLTLHDECLFASNNFCCSQLNNVCVCVYLNILCPLLVLLLYTALSVAKSVKIT